MPATIKINMRTFLSRFLSKGLAVMSISLKSVMVLGGTLGVLTSVSAQTSPRIMPKTVQAGKMRLDVAGLTVKVNGERYALSSNLRIYDSRYRIVRLSQIVEEKFLAKYWVNRHGEVEKIWILRDQENLPQENNDIRVRPN